MEAGQQMTEPGESATAMSTPHDVPIRSSGPPQSSRTFDGSHQSSVTSGPHDTSRATPGEVWAGAISRVQTQVSLNTSLLDSHRQKVQDIEGAINRLEQAVGNAMAMLHNVRGEIHSRPNPEPPRHEPEDLQVLAEQVGVISNRVNEVDALRMQVRLLENRIKRWEEHGSPAIASTGPGTGATSREASMRESQVPSQFPATSHPQPSHAPHQPLPPMRTSANISPIQTRPLLHTPQEQRQPSTESSTTMQAFSAGSFRPGEQLPPPSALPGWRMSSETLTSSSALPPQPPPPPPPTLPPAPGRPPSMQSEATTSGWAAVNTVQSTKRPYEEPRQSPYEASVTGSPKRPKLAPIMPRSNYREESSYVPSSVPNSSTAESYRGRSRAASEASPSQTQALPTPASANMPGHRFIISTQSADSQESWRPESERIVHTHQHHSHGHGHGHGHGPHGHGRRGGRGGRPRGGRGRGGRGGVALPDGQELGTPEWERADWTGSQVSANGFYHPLHHQHHSPEEASRGGTVRRGGGVSVAPSDREADFPATPLAVQGPYDPFTAGHPDSSGAQPTSGSKKSRTKPIRNSEGVLIRKDGRPDMRSVSSANNLRKVHAKKEAERAEVEGRTPTSARSLAPANSFSDDEGASQSDSPEVQAVGGEGDGEPTDTQERHRELMSRIFPSGVEEARRSASERYSPTREQQDATEAEMKVEPAREEPPQTAGEGKDGGSQMTDVVMREMSEAQTEDHQQRGEHEDTRMPTVEETSEEQEKAGVDT